MQFVFPSLAWGFLLLLVPLLVHLINLLRHRRQRWAAMEFLLESYRKHRRWVWLKQALLLLSRMLVMAILVAMLAQWISGARWLTLFGETVTHHYVVLDDSYSMSDTTLGVSAYQKALGAIGGILRSAAEGGGTQQVTLIRASRSMVLSTQPQRSGESENTKQPEARADVAADLLARTIPPDPIPLLDRLNTTLPSALDASCESALQLLAPLIENGTNERPIVYIVSDFRSKDWSRPDAVRSVLERLTTRDAKIELIDCVDAQHQNLTLEKVEPEEEVTAAGIPLMVRIQIRNHGIHDARNVQVRIRTIEYGREAPAPRPDLPHSGTVQELQPILVEQIPPGDSVSRRVQVLFPNSGTHVIEASLPDDSVAIDNRVAGSIRIEDGQKVLLVDGDAERRNSFFLEAIMNPGGNTKTGLLTQREGPEFLRDAQPEELLPFSAILLFDLPRLEPRALANLAGFAKGGGGIGIFFGSTLNDGSIQHYNDEWFAKGSGILPRKLIGISELPIAKEEGESDILPQEHPLLLPLLGLRNSPFQFMRISKYVDMEMSNERTIESSDPLRPLRVVAKLRNGAPWIIDSTWEEGKVVLFLTGLQQDWTNWAQDPTFVVTSLKLIGYLGSTRRQESSRRIGKPLELRFSAREVLPSFQVIYPSVRSLGPRVVIESEGEKEGDHLLKTLINSPLASPSEEVQRNIVTPGVVEVWSTRLQGDRVVQAVATTVSPAEGDLVRSTSSELQNALRPVETRYRQAESVQSNAALAGNGTRSTLLMALLIGFLLLEQYLAWSASFHLPRVAKGGG